MKVEGNKGDRNETQNSVEKIKEIKLLYWKEHKEAVWQNLMKREC